MLVRQLGAGLYEAIAFWQEDKTAPELKIFRKLANISSIRKGLKSKQLSTIRISDSILQTVKAFLELIYAVIFLTSPDFQKHVYMLVGDIYTIHLVGYPGMGGSGAQYKRSDELTAPPRPL